MQILLLCLMTPDPSRQKPAALIWEDPFLLDAQLSENERLIRDSAFAYCQEKLLLRVIETNRHEVLLHEIMSEMGKLGLLGLTIPVQFGGTELNYKSYSLVAR